MKATELMIGDWVYDKHHKSKGTVTTLTRAQLWVDLKEDDHWWLKYDEVEPIPLTAELLEQCGFATKDEPGHWTGYRIYSLFDEDKRCLFMLRLYEKDVRCEISLNACPYYIVFRYLHELQHALRLCRIEKEIRL